MTLWLRDIVSFAAEPGGYPITAKFYFFLPLPPLPPLPAAAASASDFGRFAPYFDRLRRRPAAAHPQTVQGSPNDMVPDTREILHPSAAHHDNRMFLKVVTLSRDV